MSGSANNKQVAGDHYRKRAVQPWDYIHQNNIGYLAGCIIKYVSRYQDKNGLEDLRKAQHYLEKLIEEESRPEALSLVEKEVSQARLGTHIDTRC